MTRKPTKAPKIAKAQGRSVKEWVGKTPDAKPPQTVRVRVFDRANGICHITGARIQTGDEWDCDHIKRLEDGGENRESNLAPALKEPHRKKTAEENKRGRKATRQRAAHIGAKPPSDNPIPQRPPPPKPEKHRKESPFAHLGLPAIARRFK
jgi:5-methylcytosine-specific restriction endonuclease McrA